MVEIDLFKRIIVVYPNDPKAWINKCLEIMDQVDRELGFPLTKNRNLNAKKVIHFLITYCTHLNVLYSDSSLTLKL